MDCHIDKIRCWIEYDSSFVVSRATQQRQPGLGVTAVTGIVLFFSYTPVTAVGCRI